MPGKLLVVSSESKVFDAFTYHFWKLGEKCQENVRLQCNGSERVNDRER